jgi:hypothetical protein
LIRSILAEGLAVLLRVGPILIVVLIVQVILARSTGRSIDPVSPRESLGWPLWALSIAIPLVCLGLSVNHNHWAYVHGIVVGESRGWSLWSIELIWYGSLLSIVLSGLVPVLLSVVLSVAMKARCELKPAWGLMWASLVLYLFDWCFYFSQIAFASRIYG